MRGLGTIGAARTAGRIISAAPVGVVQVAKLSYLLAASYDITIPMSSVGKAALRQHNQCSIALALYDPNTKNISNPSLCVVSANGASAAGVSATDYNNDNFTGCWFHCTDIGAGSAGIRLQFPTAGTDFPQGIVVEVYVCEQDDLQASPIDTLNGATGLNNGTTSTTPNSGSFGPITSANSRILCLAGMNNGDDYLSVNFGTATEIGHQTDGNNSCPSAAAWINATGTASQGQSWTLGKSQTWKMNHLTLLRV